MLRMISMACGLFAVAAALAEDAVPCVPRSGERVSVSGVADVVYVMIEERQYAAMTNALVTLTIEKAREIAAEEETEVGRVKWHGARVRVERGNGVETVVYSDGWCFSRAYERRRPNAARAPREKQKSRRAR